MKKNKTTFIFIALLCIYLAIKVSTDSTNDEFNKRLQKMSLIEHNQNRVEKQTSIRQFYSPTDIKSEKDYNKWLTDGVRQLTANMAKINLIDQKLHPIRQKRQAFGAKVKLWPRIINYEINFPERESDILTAIKYWEDYSCLNFREDASAEPRIQISEGDRSKSMGMGRGDIRKVTLRSTASICIMMHEIGHALGFMHSHQRKDRDEYLDVDVSKITEEWKDWKNEYIIKPDSQIRPDVPYDPASIMNYGRYIRGPDGDGIQVIVTKDERYKRALGQTMHPSFCDILLLNIFYGCKDVCEEFKTECNYGGFPNPKDCKKCVCPSGFGGNSCNESAGICGSILEASTVPKKFTESIGDQYIPSESIYHPTQYYQNYYHRRKRAHGKWMGGNADCHWHIRTQPGHKIKLTVNSLMAHCHRSCDYGFAEMKIRKDMRPAGIRICCQEDLDSNGQMILESETNLVVISIYGNVRLEFDYHSFGNGDSSSSSIRWPEDESKSIRSLMTKSIRTLQQKESKSIRLQHVESIRPQRNSKSIRPKGTNSIRSIQGEIKSIRPK